MASSISTAFGLCVITNEGFKYLEQIPEDAVDYIRQETNTRADKFKTRDVFMAEVKVKGYMKTAVQKAGLTIFKAKLKDKIRKILKR